jgi:hypothetical protein
MMKKGKKKRSVQSEIPHSSNTKNVVAWSFKIGKVIVTPHHLVLLFTVRIHLLPMGSVGIF